MTSSLLPHSVRRKRPVVLRALAVAIIVSTPAAFAADLFWDGVDSTANADGGVGTWIDDLGTTQNWDTLATGGVNSAWTNANGDIAIFGGTGALVTLGSAISAGGLTVNSNNYEVTGNTLTLVGVPGISVASGSGFDITSILAGSGTITKTGDGALTLGSSTGSGGTAVSTAANTFSGNYVVNAGRLGVTGDAALGAVPGAFQANHITLNGGTFMNMSQATSGTGFSAGFDVALNANRGITLAAGGGTFQVGYAKTLTVNGAVSGTGALTKPDSGTLVLAADNTYTGTTTISGGTLQLGSGGTTGSLDPASSVVFGTGTGNRLSINRTGNPTIANAITTGGRANIAVAAGQSITLSGAIAGAGEFWTGGLGTTVVSPNAGSTVRTSSNVVQSGTLSISDFTSQTLGIGNYFIGQGGSGTLRYTGTGESTTRITGASLQGNGVSTVIEVTNPAATLTLTAAVGNLGAGKGFTKAGAGTLVLSGANTYNGATQVDAGQLLINGSLNAASAVTVAAGATVGGTGSFAGALTVSGTLSPGTSVESLASGGLTLNSGSTFAFELDSSAAPASAADLQVVGGALSLSGTVNLTLSDIATVDSAFAPGTQFTLINYSGTWNGGLFTFGGNLLPDDAAFTAGLNNWQIDYNGTLDGLNFAADTVNSSYVSITVVPEPSAALAMIGGVSYLLGLCRRRHR